VKAPTIGIRTLVVYSVGLKDYQQAFWHPCRGQLSIFYLNPSFIPKNKKFSYSKIDMVCTPIYSFSPLEGKYLEPATSLHPIKAEGYEIHLDFISLVRELNFAGGLDENLYKHLLYVFLQEARPKTSLVELKQLPPGL
jgi:hypothetical protein